MHVHRTPEQVLMGNVCNKAVVSASPATPSGLGHVRHAPEYLGSPFYELKDMHVGSLVGGAFLLGETVTSAAK